MSDLDKTDHPLIQLLSFYYDNWQPDDDASPLFFQQRHGLAVDVPVGWPYVEAIRMLVDKVRLTRDQQHVVIIYPTSKIYKEVYRRLGDSPWAKYLSWHEIYVAMDVAPTDQRELSRLSDLLSKSGLTIFIGAPYGFPEVTNQVRKMCPERLIILRTPEEKEQ